MFGGVVGPFPAEFELGVQFPFRDGTRQHGIDAGFVQRGGTVDGRIVVVEIERVKDPQCGGMPVSNVGGPSGGIPCVQNPHGPRIVAVQQRQGKVLRQKPLEEWFLRFRVELCVHVGGGLLLLLLCFRRVVTTGVVTIFKSGALVQPIVVDALTARFMSVGARKLCPIGPVAAVVLRFPMGLETLQKVMNRFAARFGQSQH